MGWYGPSTGDCSCSCCDRIFGGFYANNLTSMSDDFTGPDIDTDKWMGNTWGFSIVSGKLRSHWPSGMETFFKCDTHEGLTISVESAFEGGARPYEASIAVPWAQGYQLEFGRNHEPPPAVGGDDFWWVRIGYGGAKIQLGTAPADTDVLKILISPRATLKQFDVSFQVNDVEIYAVNDYFMDLGAATSGRPCNIPIGYITRSLGGGAGQTYLCDFDDFAASVTCG